MAAKASRGVKIFAYILIYSSLFQMVATLSAGYGHFAYLHQEYAGPMLMVRYIVSWVTKTLGLVAGIGVLNLKEWARRLALFNSVVAIATVHLKHAAHAYALHLQHMERTFGLDVTNLLWPSLILQRLIDIIFGLALIYFFTRPSVKRQF